MKPADKTPENVPMKDQTKSRIRATLAPMGRRVDRAYSLVESGDVAELTRMLDAIVDDVEYAKAQLLADAKGGGE